MRSNPGKTISIYEIPEFVAHAQLHGLTAKNIVSGFQNTGIILITVTCSVKQNFLQPWSLIVMLLSN